MSELLSAAQMRAIETAAIAAGNVTGLELMERAGQGVVEAIFDTWPGWARSPRRVVVLCGPGNNGGDGFVIARLLADKGWQVETHLDANPDNLPADAKANHDRWVKTGINKPLSERSLGTVKSPPELVVDALFGTGLTRELEGNAAFLLGNLETLRQDFGVRCVAVDIPSGVCADSGRPLGCFPQVDLTVSFHTEKLGHCLERADAHCGRVVVKDIGLPHAEKSRQRAAHVWKVEPPTRAVLDKAGASQKYQFGHALVLSGGVGKTGAARLAAHGALRVGAGLVTLGVPKPALSEVAGQITALMVRPVSTANELGEILWDTRINALCLGPGLGTDARARDLVETALSMGRAMVLDADALSMYRTEPKALLSRLHDKCVLTPHGGEFARLFPDIAKRLEPDPTSGPAYSRVDAVRAAAKRAGCTILLKGPDTVIAGADGQCAIHCALFDRAAPWLATAGSGDVLAGFVTGLLARGMAPMLAAETAAWLHVQCAVDFGPGLIAEDIADALPGVLRDLWLRES
jgi:ADP-dependent NAD(P)H-hydrate dehydratase / NAD(P)H-hydrate epimerase